MMMSAAQTIQWKVVQWLVRNEFEGVWTAPVMAKYLLQYFHLKGYGQNQSWPNICYNTFICLTGRSPLRSEGPHLNEVPFTKKKKKKRRYPHLCAERGRS